MDSNWGFPGAWLPEGPTGTVADIAYNQVTGDLYALTGSGVYQNGVGNVLGLGTPINGGDIAIGPSGEFAISLSDSSPDVMIYNANWDDAILWTLSGVVMDIAFDLATGDIYAYTETGIYRMGDSDPIFSFPRGDGGDMAINSSAAVPIPSSMLLLISGLAGLAVLRRKSKKS